MRLIIGSLIMMLALGASVQACEVFVNTSRAINLGLMVGEFKRLGDGGQKQVVTATQLAAFRNSLNKQISNGSLLKRGVQKVTRVAEPLTKMIKKAAPLIIGVGKIIASKYLGSPSQVEVAGKVIEESMDYGCKLAKKRKLEKEARCNRVLVPASYISVMELCPNHEVPLSGALFSYAAIQYGSNDWRCTDIGYMIVNLVKSMPASGPRMRLKQWCDLVVSGRLPEDWVSKVK